MIADSDIDERVTALEAAVAEIRRQLPYASEGWVERFTGAFKEEPAFDEVIAHGRALRQADRPREDDGS
jgi:hypothetical protein